VQVETTKLEGVVIVTPRRREDARGFFTETWSRRAWQAAGIERDWVQDNQSLSRRTGTVRGLHYQAPPDAQAKLVRCGRGSLLDVAVDVRRGSPCYGQWLGVELSAENGRQLFIPEGFLHGFVTLVPDTEILYKCSAPYAPESDGAVRWDSAGIDWGLTGDPVVSDKDRGAPALANWRSPFRYEAGT
jgi:dTDP-4-dehydrorhamnose 3,5-epimerase